MFFRGYKINTPNVAKCKKGIAFIVSNQYKYKLFLIATLLHFVRVNTDGLRLNNKNTITYLYCIRYVYVRTERHNKMFSFRLLCVPLLSRISKLPKNIFHVFM